MADINMTREEAIHVIQSNRPTSGYTMLCEALDIAIAALSEQEERRWIPVTERLPEEEGWYLVYTTPNRDHKSINKAMFCKGYAWGNFEPYWRGVGGHWENVTHWMPLPMPPKGERNEADPI